MGGLAGATSPAGAADNPVEPLAPACVQTVDRNGFNHPGISHDCDDLRRMRTNVEAGRSPWAEGLKALAADPFSRKTYTPNPVAIVPWAGTQRESFRLRDDGMAAYQQIILWYVTGDDVYRHNALATVKAWFGMQAMQNYIEGGPGIMYLTAAAEMMRAIPASGWTDADSRAYAAMIGRIEQAKLGVDQDKLFQNQGALAAEGLMAIAVYMGDRGYWNKVVHRSTVGDNPTPGRDFAVARSILPNGQIAEMGRDQPHPTGTLRAYVQMGYTMRLQSGLGTPLLLEFDNRRIKAAFEYWADYNTGHDVTWTPAVISTKQDYRYAETYATISPGNRGRFYPNLLSGAYYYYVGIDHLQPTAMQNTRQMMKAQGPDMGWLLYARGDAHPIP